MPPDDTDALREQLAQLARENAALRARAAAEAEGRELAPFEKIGGSPAPGLSAEELAHRRRKGRRIRLALIALALGLVTALMPYLIREFRTPPDESTLVAPPAPADPVAPAPVMPVPPPAPAPAAEGVPPAPVPE